MSKNIYCQSCGTPTDNLQANFCASCGKPFKSSVDTVNSTKVIVADLEDDEQIDSRVDINLSNITNNPDKFGVELVSNNRKKTSIRELIGTEQIKIDRPRIKMSKKKFQEEFQKEAGAIRP